MTPMIKRMVFLTLVVSALVLPILLAEVIAESVQPVGQATPQQTIPRSLGQFNAGAFAGSVELLERDNDVLVYVLASTDVVVGNRVIAGGKSVPSEEIQVWMLLEQGTTGVLRHKVPAGGRAIEVCTGGCTANVIFTFEKGSMPIAVVLKWGDQFRVFPTPNASK